MLIEVLEYGKNTEQLKQEINWRSNKSIYNKHLIKKEPGIEYTDYFI